MPRSIVILFHYLFLNLAFEIFMYFDFIWPRHCTWLLVITHGYQESLTVVYLQLSQHWYESLCRLVELSTVYCCTLNWNNTGKDFIWIKNMNTIKFLDQAVTFPVECTCIPRGCLHGHSEERRRAWGDPCAGLLFPGFVQCLLWCAGFLSVKNCCYQFVFPWYILKTTPSLTFQFSNKVWQSLFCKQVNFIM